MNIYADTSIEQPVMKPAVGAQFMSEGLDGLRILVVGDSHYGPVAHLRPELTQEIVRWLGQSKRKAFFTRISQMLLGTGKGWISNAARGAVWEKVAFFNFLQELLPTSGVPITHEQCLRAKQVLPGVVAALQPDLILVLGKRIHDYIPDRFGEVEVVKGIHPSAMSHFKLDVWVENIKAAKARALARVTTAPRDFLETRECVEWAAQFACATAIGIEEKLRRLNAEYETRQSSAIDSAPDATVIGPGQGFVLGEVDAPASL